jgi:hypothetical protein
VIGLSEAMVYWGEFIGDNVFDVTWVMNKIKELDAKRDEL